MLRTVSSICPFATARSSVPSRSASRNTQPKPSVLREGSPMPARDRNIVVNPGSRGAIQADHFVIEIRDRNSGRAGIFEVADIHAHTRARFTFGAERQSRFDGDILEFSVAQISIELVRLRIVRHQQIRPAVLVEIEHRHAKRFRTAVENAAASPSHPQTFRCRDCETASRCRRDTLPACNTICAGRRDCKTHRAPATSARNCRRTRSSRPSRS